MGYIYCTKLGETMVDEFLKEAQSLEFNESVVVFPNMFNVNRVKTNKKIKLTTFDSVAEEIIKLDKTKRYTCISKNTQELILQGIINNLNESTYLDYFKIAAREAEFVQSIMETLGEFSRNGVTAIELESAINAKDEKNIKDEEIIIIYKFYTHILETKNMYDKDGIYNVAINILNANNDIEIPWKKIWFTEFYTFDAPQLELIKELRKRCEVDFDLVMEDNERKENIFEITNETLVKLIGLGFDVKNSSKVSNREANLQKVVNYWGLNEKTLMRPSNFNIYSSISIEKEVKTTLEDIKKKIIYEKIDTKDIIIIVRNLENYTGFKKYFDEYGIATTLPEAISFGYQPFAVFLNNFINFSINESSVKILEALLKSSEIKIIYDFPKDALEKIKRERFFASGSELKKYLLNDCSDSEVKNSRIIDFFKDIEELSKVQGINECCDYLEELFIEWNLQQKYGELYKNANLNFKQFKILSKVIKSAENIIKEIRKIYQISNKSILNDVLNEFYDVWEKIAMKEQINVVKGERNGVNVISAVKAPGILYKHVYLLGVNIASFPLFKNENWVYNETEKSEFRVLGLVDLKTTPILLSEDRYLFAAIIATATETINISFVKNDQTSASIYMNELLAFFEENIDNIEFKNSTIDDCCSSIELAEFLAGKNNLSEKEKEWLTLYTDKSFFDVSKIDKIRFDENSEFNGRLTQAIPSRKFSASALEMYAQCPFRYLASKVWNVDDKGYLEEDMDASIKGSIYHKALQLFFDKHKKENISKLNLEELKLEIIENFDDVFLNKEFKNKIYKNVFTDYYKAKMKDNLLKVLQKEYEYQQEIGLNLYPIANEWSFGTDTDNEFSIAIDGEKTEFVGYIDRIDQCGSKYIVTDYKKNNYKTKSDLKDGTSIQMPLYMMAVNKLFTKDSEAVVIGGGYFSIEQGKRGGGCWNNDYKADLPWIKKADAESFEELFDIGKRNIENIVRKINSLKFNVEPVGECPPYCPFSDICRKSLKKDLQEKLEE